MPSISSNFSIRYLSSLFSLSCVPDKSFSIVSMAVFNVPIAAILGLPTSYLEIPLSDNSRFRESSPFPPNITGVMFLSRSNILLFVINPPTPKRPYIDLWPANINMSMFVSFKFISMFPAACAASASTMAPYSFAMSSTRSAGST